MLRTIRNINKLLDDEFDLYDKNKILIFISTILPKLWIYVSKKHAI